MPNKTPTRANLVVLWRFYGWINTLVRVGAEIEVYLGPDTLAFLKLLRGENERKYNS